MNRHRSTAVLAALAALVVAAPAALGGDVYTWTDENGVVHYGDRPTGVPSERVIHVATERSPAPRTPAPAPRSQAAPATAAAATPATEELSEEERRAQEKERAEKCEAAKQRLQTYLTARRLYRQDENGERVYLSDEEILAARAKAQEQIVELCDE
jgi:hypothetical protein